MSFLALECNGSSYLSVLFLFLFSQSIALLFFSFSNEITFFLFIQYSTHFVKKGKLRQEIAPTMNVKDLSPFKPECTSKKKVKWRQKCENGERITSDLFLTTPVHSKDISCTFFIITGSCQDTWESRERTT